MITCREYSELELFKKDVILFLENKEVENNLLLGVLSSIKNGAKPTFMGTVLKDNKLAGVLLQTTSRLMICSTLEDISEEEVDLVAKQIHLLYPKVPGLVGEKNVTIKLATLLANHQNTVPTLHMNQRIYKLTSLNEQPVSNGEIRIATLQDLQLIKDWLWQFSIDALEPIPEGELEQKATSLIEKNGLHIWEVNGHPVSMANVTRPTKTNITVNAVFTPQEERKKGYATSCVARLTNKMLEKGYKSTSLYTDLDNPTSNKIYIEIGYKPILDSVVYYIE